MSERNLSSAQFTQLPMLMTAGEITKNYSAGDGDRRGGESDTDLYSRKYHEASQPEFDNDTQDWGTPLRERLSTGVHTPVKLSDPTDYTWGGMYTPSQKKPMVLDGHHRIATMLHDNPKQLLPVTFEGTSGERNRSL